MERLGAEAGVSAGDIADIDLKRAQAEAARRAPSTGAAKVKMQQEALTAWWKIQSGQPLDESERRWGLFGEQELANFVTGGDTDVLKAMITAMFEASGKVKPPERKPIQPPAGKPEAKAGAAPPGLPPAAEHNGRTLRYKDGRRFRSDGKTWLPVQ
jgi:hypothetical protein